MTPRCLRSSAGFTYIGALMTVVIVGIMLSQAALIWKTKMQREREVELIFRGTQIRDAMRRWYGWKVPIAGAPPQQPQPGATPPAALTDLKHLLLDPNKLTKARYLRASNLIDPITGGEWEPIKNGEKIIGVKSKSEAVPIKKANFPFDLDPAVFNDKKKYNEWVFIYNNYPRPGSFAGKARPPVTNISPRTE